MPKPLLLVDVDGVLNVFGFGIEGYPSGAINPAPEFEKVFAAQGYTISFPLGLTGRMAKLNEAFECVWATIWEDQANKLIAPELGVGYEWPVIKFQGWGRQYTWKLPDVREWCEENARGRRVAWVDDDLHSDAEEWAEERDRAGEPTVLVSTNYQKGLTDRLTLELLEWAING